MVNEADRIFSAIKTSVFALEKVAPMAPRKNLVPRFLLDKLVVADSSKEFRKKVNAYFGEPVI